MSHSATTEHTTPPSRRLRTEVDERAVPSTDDHRSAQEIKAALSAIPAGCVTARTAGSLRVPGPRRTIRDERAAFEQAVAEENTRATEG